MEHDKECYITVTNKQHPRKKTRYVALTSNVERLLYQYEKEHESKITVRQGKF